MCMMYLYIQTINYYFKFPCIIWPKRNRKLKYLFDKNIFLLNMLIFNDITKYAYIILGLSSNGVLQSYKFIILYILRLSNKKDMTENNAHFT